MKVLFRNLLILLVLIVAFATRPDLATLKKSVTDSNNKWSLVKVNSYHNLGLASVAFIDATPSLGLSTEKRPYLVIGAFNKGLPIRKLGRNDRISNRNQ